MKTTSIRARALSHALQSGTLKGTLCALLAGTALCGLAAAPAAAQTPPAHRNFDSNGVDLVHGDYLLSFVEGSIGSGDGELALVRTVGSAAGGASHWDGIRLSLTRSYSGGPATVTVTMANKSERFTESGGTFTSSLAMGSSLTGGGGGFTYAARDGTAIGFSDPSGNAQGGTTNFCKNSLQTNCSLVPTDISTPDGRTVTLDWTLNDRCSSVYNPDGSLDCEYDWRLASVANDFGQSIAFAYASGPPGGQPPASWYERTGASFNAGAASVGYSYPSNGVTDVTDTGGRVWRVGAGTIRRPGASADTTVVTTNSGGTVSSVANEGVTTNYARSVSGNVATMTVTQVDPGGPDPVTTIVSDVALSRPTLITDPLGHDTAFQYTAGRLTRVTTEEGNYVQYSHDSRGNVTQTQLVPKSGSGATIVTSATFPSSCSGNVACNQPTSTTDERGQVTDYDWDTTYGVLNSVTLPAPGSVRPQTRFAYTLDSASGRYQLTGTTQCQTGSAPSCLGTADEVKTTIVYNSDGTIASTSSGDGTGSSTTTATSAMAYDPIGNLVSVDGPLSGTADTVHLRYNAARELVGTVSPDPDGSGTLKPRAVRNSYSNGLLTKVETGNVDSPSDTHWAAFAPAQEVHIEYDYVRPAKRKLVANGTTYALTQTSYDAFGRVDCVAQRMDPNDFGSTLPGACSLTTPDGAHGPDRIVRTSYDAAGRAIEVRTALGVTGEEAVAAAATYTPNGLVETMKDGESRMTTWEYDGHDRLAKIRYPDPSTANASSTSDYEQFGYESLAGGTRTSGLAISFRNRAGETIGSTHDALGRLTARDMPGSELDVTYGYDLLGRTTSASHSGGSLTFAYDSFGRNVKQTGASGDYESQYDLAGRRIRLDHPDSFYVTQEYNVTGDVVAIRESGSTLLATYEYDQLGRRDRLVLGNGAVTDYQYDDASRLWRLTHDPAGTAHDNTIELAYNPAGQIVSREATNNSYAWTGHGNGSTSSTIDGLNRLTAQQYGSTTTSFSHDARSNRLNDETRTYAYDSENKGRGVATSPFHYDPVGRLSGVSTSANTPPALAYESYVDNLIAERTPGSSSVGRRHVFGPGVDEPLVWYEGSGNTDRRFLQADERGSIVAVSDGSAAVQNVNRYDEYGRTQSSNGYWLSRFGYTGQRYFGGFGLYHYKNRMYDPKAGRFMQADPIGYDDGMNLYAYVGGDPVNLTDPSGLSTCPAGTHKVDDPTGSRIPRCVADGSGGTSSGLNSNRAALVLGGGNWADSMYIPGSSGSVSSSDGAVVVTAGSPGQWISRGSSSGGSYFAGDIGFHLAASSSDCGDYLINPCALYRPISDLKFQAIARKHFGQPNRAKSVFRPEWQSARGLNVLYRYAMRAGVPQPDWRTPGVYNLSVTVPRAVGWERYSGKPTWNVTFMLYQRGTSVDGKPIYEPSNAFPGLP